MSFAAYCAAASQVEERRQQVATLEHAEHVSLDSLRDEHERELQRLEEKWAMEAEFKLRREKEKDRLRSVVAAIS